MNDNASVDRHLETGSRRLYLLFSGLARGLEAVPFSFVGQARQLPGSKIYLRDLQQCWYHAGLVGISSDIPSTVDFLRKEIDSSGASELVWVGNSMGGYAAMLFASLVGRGRVVAFAPQSYLSPGLRLWYRNRRAQAAYLRMYRKCLFKPKVWDLRRHLLRCRHELEIDIYYPAGHYKDGTHVERLRGIPGVRPHPVEDVGHGMVRTLRDNGRLQSILAAA